SSRTSARGASTRRTAPSRSSSRTARGTRRRRRTSSTSGGRPLLQPEDRAGDDEPLDLARSLVDLGDLRVAVVALDRELLRVAVAAEDLDRLARLPPRHLGGEELGLRAGLGVRQVVLLQPRGAVDEQAGGVDLRRHVGELVLDGLERRDRLPERVTLLRVLARDVVRRLGDAD